jgi:DNA polymerase
MNCISTCQNCNLCQNQKPLLDKQKISDVLWVGLSAKEVENVNKNIPLSNDTNTGKIIESIENAFTNIYFYKSNLVKCLPLDDNNKIRYPEKNEMDACFSNLLLEIEMLNPKIVFLLGNKVGDFVKRKFKNKAFQKSISKKLLNILDSTIFETVYHPSYIHIYKSKQKHIYIENIQEKITNLFKEQIKAAS